MKKRIHVLFTLMLAFGMLAGVLAQAPPKPKKLSKKVQETVDAARLGSMENPVRCDKTEGAKAYIARLRCPSDKPPKFEFYGSVGAGPYGTTMDYYILTCKKTGSNHNVFLDIYHKSFVEIRAIPDFTIVESKEKKGS